MSGYVPACAHPPPNQYGIYGGPAANYMSTGPHWQARPSSLTPGLTPGVTHPSSAASLEAADFHTMAAFKLLPTEGETGSNTHPDI